MWISRAEYEYFEHQISEYKYKADLLDTILDAAKKPHFDKSHPGIMITEDAYIVSKNSFDDILSELNNSDGKVLSLTAERDWYKNAYAELKCKIGDGL